LIFEGLPVFRFGQSTAKQSSSKLVLALVLTASLGAFAPSFAKRQSPETASVALSSLPAEAQRTHRLILAGGPFPYDKDGTVFGNRERLLPAQSRGYYREYTVKTQGSRDRGARRIVCGGRQPTQPEACFYTGDHYASFQLIAQ
jgi:ribonuclease T1